MIFGALPKADALKPDVAGARARLAASGVGGEPVTLNYPSDLTINGVSFTTVAQKVSGGPRTRRDSR